jgi:iron(III) transport system ATP-binding protein
MAHLVLDSVTKSYGGHRILHGVSLAVEKGEFVSLLGPSGSGKTTLLRCLAGLERPDDDSGPITLAGEQLSGRGAFVPPERRNLGMVFQNYAVWPHLDVFENVAFPLRIRKEPGLAAKVAEAIGRVKLDGYERRYAHELSGGQQQRVALARALAMSPRLLLLDEPLSNLDALLREELGAEIRRLQRALGLTCILVTHDQREALSLSDRIVLLQGGRIEAAGAPEELYARPPTPFTAGFLSGAQTLTVAGAERTLLPRRWRRVQAGEAPEADALELPGLSVSTRVFLGSEYQYWAEGPGLSEPVRFFSAERLEMGAAVALRYPGSG